MGTSIQLVMTTHTQNLDPTTQRQASHQDAVDFYIQ